MISLVTIKNARYYIRKYRLTLKRCRWYTGHNSSKHILQENKKTMLKTFKMYPKDKDNKTSGQIVSSWNLWSIYVENNYHHVELVLFSIWTFCSFLFQFLVGVASYLVGMLRRLWSRLQPRKNNIFNVFIW